jgi:DNA-binding XRE family transcriptional regulator
MTVTAYREAGAALRAARKAAALTQWELARKTGVSASWVSQAENGRVCLAPAYAAAMAGLLGLDAGDLARPDTEREAWRPWTMTAQVRSHRDVPALCPCDWAMTFVGGRVSGWAVAQAKAGCIHHGERARRG